MYQPTGDETLQEREPLPHLGSESRVRHELALPHGEVEHLLRAAQLETPAVHEIAGDEPRPSTDHAIRRLLIVTLHDEQLLVQLEPSADEEALTDLIRTATAAALPLQPDFVDSFGISVVDRRMLDDERTEVPSILDQLHEHGTATRPLPNGRIEWFRRSADDPSVVLAGLMPEVILPNNNSGSQNSELSEPFSHSTDETTQGDTLHDEADTQQDLDIDMEAEPKGTTPEHHEIFQYQWWFVKRADGTFDIEDEQGKSLRIDPDDKKEIVTGLEREDELVIYRERDSVYQRTRYKLLKTAADPSDISRIPLEVVSESGPLEKPLIELEQEWTNSDGDSEVESDFLEVSTIQLDGSKPLLAPGLETTRRVDDISQPSTVSPTTEPSYYEDMSSTTMLDVSVVPQVLPTTPAAAQQAVSVPELRGMHRDTSISRSIGHPQTTLAVTPRETRRPVGTVLMPNPAMTEEPAQLYQPGDDPSPLIPRVVAAEPISPSQAQQTAHTLVRPLSADRAPTTHTPTSNRNTVKVIPPRLTPSLSATQYSQLTVKESDNIFTLLVYEKELSYLPSEPSMHSTAAKTVKADASLIDEVLSPSPEPLQPELFKPSLLTTHRPPTPRRIFPDRSLYSSTGRRDAHARMTEENQGSAQMTAETVQVETISTTKTVSGKQEVRRSQSPKQVKMETETSVTPMRTTEETQRAKTERVGNDPTSKKTRQVGAELIERRHREAQKEMVRSHHQGHKAWPQQTLHGRLQREVVAEPFGVPNTAQAVIEAVLARKTQRAALPGQSQPGLKLIVHHPGQVSPSRIRGLSQLISSIAGFSAVGELYHDRFATHLLTDSPILQAEFITHLQHHRVERVQNRWQYWLTA